MPLSAQGLPEIRKACHALGVPLTILNLTHLDSLELLYRGVANHYPSILVYRKRTLSRVLPGYLTSAGYQKQIREALRKLEPPSVVKNVPAWRPITPAVKASWIEVERVRLPGTVPYYSWFKAFSGTRWAIFSQDYTSYQPNVLVNLDTSQTLATDHPGLTPVSSPDGKLFVTYWPASGRGMIFYDLHSFTSGIKTPFYERKIAPDYHTIALLEAGESSSRYRLVNGQGGEIRSYDFSVVFDRKENGPPKVSDFSEALLHCENITHASLPMLSKDGRLIGISQGEKRTTAVVRLNPAGGPCELVLDLGYETGKVEFSYDNTAIVYHASRANAERTGTLRSVKDLFVTRAYYYDLNGKYEIPISSDADTDAQFPFIFGKGQVMYHNRATHELVTVKPGL